MDRRRFLQRLTAGLLATAATAVLDPDELLWVPGQKTFFLPSPVAPAVSGQAVTLLTPQWITVEALRMFENTLTLTKGFNRKYDGRFVGRTVNVRTPPRYTTVPLDQLIGRDVAWDRG